MHPDTNLLLCVNVLSGAFWMVCDYGMVTTDYSTCVNRHKIETVLQSYVP